MMHDYDPNRFQEYEPANAKPPTYFWWIFLVVLAGIVLATTGVVWANEPGRPHVITVTFPGKDYDHVQRTSFTLGPVIYDSRETCNIAITRVRVHLSGVRLRCDPLQ